MTASIPVIPRGGRLVAVLAIVLVGLSMRTAVAVIGPVFSIISDELDFDVIVLSAIGAAPPLAFAAAGLVGPRLVRRFGLEPMLIVGISAMAIGQGLRAFSFEPGLLIAATIFAMLGIGMANVLLPPLVRRYFPERIGGMTSLYLVLMCIGASVPAFTAVQIADAVGWRYAIGLWVILPLIAIVPWLVMLRSPRPVDPVTAPITIEPTVVEFDDGEDEARPVATASAAGAAERRAVAVSPTAWCIVAAFAMASISIYAAIAYLPSILVAAGVAPVLAASALGVAVALGIPQALIVPLLATRRWTVAPMIAFAAVCGVVGWVGMLLAPAAAPLLWGALIGSVPIAFPLALLLVNTRTRSHRVTVSVSGFVQGLGYVAAGVSSFGIGLLHDATGSWTVPMIVVLGSLVLAVPAIAILRHDRLVDDELVPPVPPVPRP